MFPFFYDSNGSSVAIHNQHELNGLIEIHGEENVLSACLADWRMYEMPVYSLYNQGKTNSLAKRIEDYSSHSCSNNEHHTCSGMAQEYIDKACYCKCHVKIIRIPKGTEMVIPDGRNSMRVTSKCDMEKEVYLTTQEDYLFKINERTYRVDKSLVTVVKN